MFNDPGVGESIVLDGKSYMFIEVPEAPGIVYAELGKKAKVYRIMQGNQACALKVFKPAYRNPEITRNTDLISKFQNVRGLAVAERSVVIPKKYPQLIDNHPEFSYSVLMPWIEGKVWGNYITAKLPMSRTESLRLARTLVDALYGLEERDIAHCDLSGGNFIFSPDYSHIELVDIEELYGIGLRKPDPLPSGTSGYSPDWVRKNGLWEAAGDRFAGGILISEILGWQYEDVREASSMGDSFFADGELGQETKRYALLKSRLAQLHPGLVELFEKIWHSSGTEECPRLLEWKKNLEEMAEQPIALNWGWESLDLPGVVNRAKVEPQQIKNVNPTEALQSAPQKISNYKEVNKTTTVSIPEVEFDVKPWPDTSYGAMNSRNELLARIFMVFAGLGIAMFILISVFGNTILQVASELHKQSGQILPDGISSAVLGLLVGSAHSWIYRNNIRKSKVGLFILPSAVGGLVGGIVTGILTNSHALNDAFLAGALIGCIAGTVSSVGQNLFMRSQGVQRKWLFFNLASWTLIWAIGAKISWNANSGIALGETAAFIIIASGIAVSMFLRYFPEIEF